ncbi:MAG TPA: long-chain fatty acid--CoA ligase [Candidatus Manganitrophaceae bacterium]|nr:long-chain fatty acid--CoA ligase [Candidatus Manganitrophaceae bacterium]
MSGLGPIESIPTLLQRQAERYPNKIFLFFKEQEVAYRQLNERADRVAEGFARFKIRPGDKVALFLPNMPEFLYAFFGAMKLGAVAVPINTQLKGEEAAYILKNSESRALITTPALYPVIQPKRAELSQLEQLFLVGERGGEGKVFSSLYQAGSRPLHPPPGEGARPGDPAALIYTSGTTGAPKGVILTHRNYLFDVEQFVRATHMTDQDRFLCILPLFHVNGQVVTTLSPLYAGGSMVLMEKFSPKDFFKTLERFRATAFSGVPTIYAILLNAEEAKGADLSSLRFCVCGAAPMPVELFQKFEAKFSAFILEGYGLSEGTCVSSVNPLGGKRKIGSIGLPLPDQEMKIFNDRDEEVSPGEVGEIVVRGGNVMTGYFKNPAATEEALRGGWLHTGDLGYQDEEGYFFIVGRKKEMIIRGGENIYPKEIEELLYRHPKVLEAAVIGLPDPIWGEEVAAFIIPKPETTLTPEEILSYCRERLAKFKSPREAILVEAFPKTATGKVQKGRLRDEYLRRKKG